MKNIKKMAKKKQKQKKTEKNKYYPENGFVYHDTGYNNLYLTNVDTTFESDFKYSIVMD